jgi:hypothetical protein
MDMDDVIEEALEFGEKYLAWNSDNATTSRPIFAGE